MTEKVEVENDAPDEGEPARSGKPRSGIIIVVLSVLLGILLLVGAAGFFMACRVDRKLEAELVSVKEELRKKNVAHDDMKSQYEALSRQVAILKEYAIARSGAAGGDPKETESHPVPSDKAKPASREVPPPVAEPAKAPVPQAAGDKRRKSGEDKTVNCDLLGKSLEEKEETLRRCVGTMDGTVAKPRLR